MPSLEEYVNEIKDMWDSHWLTNMGVKHEELKQRLCEYLSVKNLELFTNGHMALELSLQALELEGEVITTPFTFASTTHAIVRNGLTPVFCDIKEDDFTIDTKKIESLITKRTCAIVPVHVYGDVCDTEAIGQIAEKYGLKVLYDAAHAFGETYKGVGIGNFGDVSCFSFHATKVFNTIEGGATSYRDSEIGRKLHLLKNFGITGPEQVEEIGANAKMNEFCAAMGICNLRHIDEEIDKRKKITERYRECLGGVRGLRFRQDQSDVKSNYLYFPIVIDENKFGANRDQISETLAEEGIGARKYFYPLTSAFDCYQEQFDVNQTPVALEVSRQVLTLPLYSDLAVEDVDRICKIVLGCQKR